MVMLGLGGGGEMVVKNIMREKERKVVRQLEKTGRQVAGSEMCTRSDVNCRISCFPSRADQRSELLPLISSRQHGIMQFWLHGIKPGPTPRPGS